MINSLKCPMCRREYNSITIVPQLLKPCGHTICEVCLYKMNGNSSDKENFVCNINPNQLIRILEFSTNTEILDKIKTLEESKTTKGSSEHDTVKTPSAPLSSKIKLVKNGKLIKMIEFDQLSSTLSDFRYSIELDEEYFFTLDGDVLDQGLELDVTLEEIVNKERKVIVQSESKSKPQDQDVQPQSTRAQNGKTVSMFINPTTSQMVVTPHKCGLEKLQPQLYEGKRKKKMEQNSKYLAVKMSELNQRTNNEEPRQAYAWCQKICSKDGIDFYKYPSATLTSSELVRAKIIMVVGQTGSGKTTLLNSFLNFVLGVQFQDKFRYQIIVEETGKDECESQTSEVTQYSIKAHNGYPPLIIIDTPGFGDTSGVHKDIEVTELIRNFFLYTIYDSVHAICFVAKSPDINQWIQIFDSKIELQINMKQLSSWKNLTKLIQKSNGRDKEKIQIQYCMKPIKQIKNKQLMIMQFHLETLTKFLTSRSYKSPSRRGVQAMRLTAPQKYIFSSILKLFGNDIGGNFIAMLTFCDGSTPKIVAALESPGSAFAPIFEKQQKGSWYLKFNNSAIFSTDNDVFSKLFWDVGMSSFSSFMEKLNTLPIQSFRLTKEVIRERQSLEHVLTLFQPELQRGLNKLEELKQLEYTVKTYSNQINQCQNFDITITVTKFEKIELEPGLHTTTCFVCNRTCHRRCNYANDEDKHKCIAMKDGYCEVCPGKCFWNNHNNVPYIFKYYDVKETKRSNELFQQYQNANSGQTIAQQTLKGLENEIKDVCLICLSYQEKIRCAMKSLNEIALRPGVHDDEQEYIQLMILSEEDERKSGYIGRIKALKALAGFYQNMRDAYNNQGEFKEFTEYAQNRLKLERQHAQSRNSEQEDMRSTFVSFFKQFSDQHDELA